MKPSPGTVKIPSITAPMKLMSAARAFASISSPHILAVNVHDPPDMRFEQRLGVAAGKGGMAGIVEEPHRLAGMPHQEADLGVGLDDGAHVVVEGHAHSEIGHPLGEFGELAPVGGPFVRRQPRTVGDRPPDSAVPPARGVGINDVGAAHVPQELQMRSDRIELGRDLLLGAAPVVPARDQRKPVPVEDRPQHGRLAGELAAKLGPGVAR